MIEIGDHVIFVDSTSRRRHALVTAIHGYRSIEERVESVRRYSQDHSDKEAAAEWLKNAEEAPLLKPSINVVIVSDDDKKTDPYGRQLDSRPTSVPNREQQAAHGYYWVEA